MCLCPRKLLYFCSHIADHKTVAELLLFYILHYRYTWVTGKEPLTYYDMNLSAQDHQTFFTGDTPQLRPEDAGKFYSVTSNHTKM